MLAGSCHSSPTLSRGEAAVGTPKKGSARASSQAGPAALQVEPLPGQTAHDPVFWWWLLLLQTPWDHPNMAKKVRQSRKSAWEGAVALQGPGASLRRGEGRWSRGHPPGLYGRCCLLRVHTAGRPEAPWLEAWSGPERSRDADRASPGQDAGGAEEAGPRSVQPEHG